ncbi:MAG: hypothetical protein BWY76_00134 [bacterium ADurb.Bin429]|nr:MAG: hypothetical protein BWY76_00134 [bacterium ADurb.Bin429]
MHAPGEAADALGVGQKIAHRRAADNAAAVQRVSVDDVVADTRMYGERHPQPRRRRLHAVALVRVRHAVMAGRHAVGGDQRQQVGQRPQRLVGRVRRRQRRQVLAQRIGRRDFQVLFLDERPHRRPVAQPVHPAGGEGEVDPAPRLLPGAELPPCHVRPHVLAAAPQVGELPVVDGAGAVGRQVRHPPLLDERDEHRPQPVFNEVRAVGEHHRPLPRPRRADARRQQRHLLRLPSRQRRRRPVRSHGNLLNRQLAHPLAQRKHLQLSAIQPRHG